MRDITTINLIDLLPDSIRSDPKVAAAAEAINGELQAVSALAGVPSIIARIDELSGEQLDHLAWQYDSKIYRDSWPLYLKRSVIRTVILEKSKKGTRSAVVNALESLGSAVELREWWEQAPVGTPHTFQITVSVADIPGQTGTQTQQDLFLRLDDVKPVRSHYNFNLALQGTGEMALVGAARPASFYRINADSWTPAILFSQGHKGAWYEANPYHLYQNADGSAPVTAAGEPVGMMLDLSGNSNHVTQSMSSARPEYRVNSGVAWLDGDGVDDRMEVPEALIPGGASLRFTSFVIRTGAASNVKIFASGTGASGNGKAWRLGINGANGAVRVEVQGDNVIGTVAINDEIPHIVTVYTTGPSLSDVVIRVDGLYDFISSPGAMTIDTDAAGAARFFSREDDLVEGAAELTGIVHIPDGVPSSQNIIKVEQYLAKLAGITL